VPAPAIRAPDAEARLRSPRMPVAPSVPRGGSRRRSRVTGSEAVDDGLAADIAARLRAAARPERAAAERAYLKSDLAHLGCGVPAVRAAVGVAARARPPGSHDQLLEAVEDLWATGIHERRLAAVELLHLATSLLGPGDAPVLARLAGECRTWALLDPLAIGVVGELVARDPGPWGSVLDGWALDADFWLRRAALLALLRPLRAGHGDWPRFSRYADHLLDDSQFFVRKAIGWVLRETGRKRPELVASWLVPRAARASAVTLREALKPLSAEQQEAVRAAAAGRSR
jgi:3-methyladenine DNA glycosylase AlkD